MTYLSSLSSEKVEFLSQLPSFQRKFDGSIAINDHLSLAGQHKEERKLEESYRAEAVRLRHNVEEERSRVDEVRELAIQAEVSHQAEMRRVVEESRGMEEELDGVYKDMRRKDDAILRLQQSVNKKDVHIKSIKAELEAEREERERMKAFVEEHVRRSAEVEAKYEFENRRVCEENEHLKQRLSSVQSELENATKDKEGDRRYIVQLEGTVLRLERKLGIAEVEREDGKELKVERYASDLAGAPPKRRGSSTRMRVGVGEKREEEERSRSSQEKRRRETMRERKERYEEEASSSPPTSPSSHAGGHGGSLNATSSLLLSSSVLSEGKSLSELIEQKRGKVEEGLNYSMQRGRKGDGREGGEERGGRHVHRPPHHSLSHSQNDSTSHGSIENEGERRKRRVGKLSALASTDV
mmetsp:Transcript_33534/g.85807  ORF Transcript_33534/g.85807 Transcript_33534/m.85807 type:complete len:411 (-) Transcript_33534:1613-2845(-)